MSRGKHFADGMKIFRRIMMSVRDRSNPNNMVNVYNEEEKVDLFPNYTRNVFKKQYSSQEKKFGWQNTTWDQEKITGPYKEIDHDNPKCK